MVRQAHLERLPGRAVRRAHHERVMVTEIRLTAAWVAAQIAGAIAMGDPVREFGDVSIDTRTLKAGDLFIAIRGDRFDGAEFAEAAIDVGAGGVVVPRGWSASRSAARSAKGSGERAVVIEITVIQAHGMLRCAVISTVQAPVAGNDVHTAIAIQIAGRDSVPPASQLVES